MGEIEQETDERRKVKGVSLTALSLIQRLAHPDTNFTFVQNATPRLRTGQRPSRTPRTTRTTSSSATRTTSTALRTTTTTRISVTLRPSDWTSSETSLRTRRKWTRQSRSGASRRRLSASSFRVSKESTSTAREDPLYQMPFQKDHLAFREERQGRCGRVQGVALSLARVFCQDFI